MKNSPRFLLILFALAFLAMQIVSFMSTLTKHEERVTKLEKQAVQFETKGTYIDLKMNPAVELMKEQNQFRTETVHFVFKVLVILVATAFVLILMRRAQKGGVNSNLQTCKLKISEKYDPQSTGANSPAIEVCKEMHTLPE